MENNIPTPLTRPPEPARQATARLGDALRARRKALGISATAAAEAAGISRVTWHRLEKGEPTVALGSLLEAARVLNLDLKLHTVAEKPITEEIPYTDFLPLRIRLSDYPQLRNLAWQVSDAAEQLTPREALGLYERNWRHTELDHLEPRERTLIKALRDTFGAESLRV